LEVVPDAKLVFTWAWRSMPERESLVTVLLRPDGDGTLLTLTHERFFDEDARDRHRSGWSGALDKLERHLA
ncbi:MAG TPA: SRPBCC domain-containing protein, partial [Geminicoccaceae bacterium]|nr:SRPBCC domain-containing protein [Geminicoccaceae bacterium]